MTYMTYRQIISEKNAEIDRLKDEIERLQKEYDIMRFTTAKRWVKEAKSETRKEFANKITEVFKRYKHLHEHANKAKNDVIETFDLTEIEMQSVWDVMTLEKNDMAEYEEMGRLQNNIETIAQDRLLTELENDFKLLLKEMAGD